MGLGHRGPHNVQSLLSHKTVLPELYLCRRLIDRLYGYKKLILVESPVSHTFYGSAKWLPPT